MNYLAVVPPEYLCPCSVLVSEPIAEFRHLFGPADLLLVVFVGRPVVRGPIAVLAQPARLCDKLLYSRALSKEKRESSIYFLTSSTTATSPGTCSATVKTPSERSRGDSSSLL